MLAPPLIIKGGAMAPVAPPCDRPWWERAFSTKAKKRVSLLGGMKIIYSICLFTQLAGSS